METHRFGGLSDRFDTRQNARVFPHAADNAGVFLIQRVGSTASPGAQWARDARPCRRNRARWMSWQTALMALCSLSFAAAVAGRFFNDALAFLTSGAAM
ncbi:hypothetical protein ROLI_009980 [Roseobacter fucihabitans]|uniref:Uncharacterized protein n=1 Tax=Roseobacter fucihabitans TaxID=1537242 RepID=A0ABZ2BQC0_9RHOB|nr:hypothetical protein [Roseobacter litoralis]MBC6965460.1 hypothetical protein [Roseobacter litoralis]